MAQLAFWYEFASTYSYLSATRIEALAKENNVSITWKPFLLGPIFKELGWHTSPFKIYRQKGEYMWRDMERICKNSGLPPLTRPEQFPQHSLLGARIATIGQKENWIARFSKKLFTRQFAQGANINDENVLMSILDEMHLNSEEIVDKAKNDTEIKNAVRHATEEAQKIGLFGAPSFVADDGEIFWGNDRLEDAIDWAIKISKK